MAHHLARAAVDRIVQPPEVVKKALWLFDTLALNEEPAEQLQRLVATLIMYSQATGRIQDEDICSDERKYSAQRGNCG